MKYRYFYDANGTIMGFSAYKRITFAIAIGDSVGYIDTDNQVDIAQYRVDISTQQLVPI